MALGQVRAVQHTGRECPLLLKAGIFIYYLCLVCKREISGFLNGHRYFLDYVSEFLLHNILMFNHFKFEGGRRMEYFELQVVYSKICIVFICVKDVAEGSYVGALSFSAEVYPVKCLVRNNRTVQTEIAL